MNQNEHINADVDSTEWIKNVAVMKDPDKFRVGRVLALIAVYEPISYNNLFRLSDMSKATFQKIMAGLREALDYEEVKASKLVIKPKLYRLKDSKRGEAITLMSKIIRDFDFVVKEIDKTAVKNSTTLDYTQFAFMMFILHIFTFMAYRRKMLSILQDSSPERSYVYSNLYDLAVSVSDKFLITLRKLLPIDKYELAINYFDELLQPHYLDKLLDEFIRLLKYSINFEKDKELSKTFYAKIAEAIIRGIPQALVADHKNKDIEKIIKDLEKWRDSARAERFRKGSNKIERRLYKVRG